MKLASIFPSRAYNFEVAPKFQKKNCGPLPKQTQSSVFANITASMAGGFAALSLLIFLVILSAVPSLFLNLLLFCTWKLYQATTSPGFFSFLFFFFGKRFRHP
jgi:hypothetical protein